MWGYFCGAGWLPVSAGMKGKNRIGKKCLFIPHPLSLIPSLVCTYVLCWHHQVGPAKRP